MRELSKKEVEKKISIAETELCRPDERAIRLWERIRITPEKWLHEQYPDGDQFWVIAVMGSRCLYYNHVEGGWGWGQYERWGKVCDYHWQDLKISQAVFQTLFAIDSGGKG